MPARQVGAGPVLAAEETPVSVVVEDHVGLVTIDRPAIRNAVSPAVAAELEAAVDALESDPTVRAVVLTGAGSVAFCAGADLREVAAGNADGLYTARGGFAGFVDAPRRKPWIAALNGLALAGGLEITLACDMVVAADHAELGLPEVARGLIAAGGGLRRLPLALPRAVALEMIATGRRISAARAYALGLVNAVVPPEELVPRALMLAREIAGNAPLAVRASLDLARRAVSIPEREFREATRAARAEIMASQDYREGSRAFLEKRSPDWTGR